METKNRGGRPKGSKNRPTPTYVPSLNPHPSTLTNPNGAGRPKGSTNKVSPKELLEDFKRQSGMSFEQFLNSRILLAAAEQNSELVSRYIIGLSKYFLAENPTIDIASAGLPIAPTIIFNSGVVDGYDSED